MFQHVVNTVDVNTLKIIAEMIQRKNPIIQERRVNQATNHAENPVNTKRPRNSRRSRVRSGVVDSVKNTGRPEMINQVTQNVEIPQMHHSDKMIDVPVVLQRQVPNVQAVHKNVEIHQAAVHRQNFVDTSVNMRR